LGALPTTFSPIKTFPPFTFIHHTRPVLVDKHLALSLQLSRESLGEKESIERVEKRVGTKESEQELKS
jgi:hypothetical protein